MNSVIKQQSANLIGFLVLTVAITAVSFYGIQTFRSLRIKEIDSELDYQCAQTYRYTQTFASGVVVSYPMEKEYGECLSSK